ncbi:MAG TPA: hypothetical protein PL181_12075 [bacterium]|nr:hypothetical protein [bacterium]
MKTIKITLMFIGISFFIAEIVRAQHIDANANEYSTEGFYVRQNGNWWFPIGTYFEAFADPVTEEFFNSIREYFDAYYVSLNTLDFHGGAGITNPNDLNDPTAVWLPTGIAYLMRRDTLGIDALNDCIAAGRISDTDPLGPDDQAHAAARLNNSKGIAILDTISSIAEITNKDLIFMLPDEPERGNSYQISFTMWLDNWYFHGDLLQRFTDLRDSSRTGSLTYLDLGPTYGSKLIFNRIYPDSVDALSNCLPEYDHDRFTESYPNNDYDRNLDTTINEYWSSSDILGINNYELTVNDPAVLGRNVKKAP